MSKRLRYVLCAAIIIVATGTILKEGGIAGILRSRNNTVLLGEWQPRQNSGTGKKGFFLSEINFAPGTKLALGILLEQPGESVTIRWSLEAPGKAKADFEQKVQDGGPNDLSPKAATIFFEFAEIPSNPAYPVDRYIVDVDDESGKPPVRMILESPPDYLKSPGSVLSKMLNIFRKVPKNIATPLLTRERALSKDAFRTLVVADAAGKTLHTLTPVQNGGIRSPIWLPTAHILFIEERGALSRLKIVPSDLKGKPQDFGGTVTEGAEAQLTPDGQAIVFRRGTSVLSANLSGSKIIPLIQDREILQILGVAPGSESGSYHLVFSAKGAGSIAEQWSAKIQETDVISLRLLSDDFDWLLFAELKMHGAQMLYELWDAERKVWEIYRSQSLEEEGTKIVGTDSSARYPSWSLDGSQIVFVQAEKQQ
ncbi:MAG: hypothetical protein GY801_21640 [bacterium]|nr:hypothetical protein [bacterium]